MKQQRVPDAPESNAGDDFHILWAIRKSFELLNFSDKGLKALTVEGATPQESEEIDPQGNQLLAIDLAEYYGSESFDTAHQVIFSQLKYSTRQYDVPWTASRMCTSSKGGHKGSIVNRLATSFNAYVVKYGREVVLCKLRIKLVSNRPADVTLKTVISTAQLILKDNLEVRFLKDLKKKFQATGSKSDKSIESEWDKLFEAAELPAASFIDFLRVLDFDDCGTDSRYFQKQEIVKAIGEVTDSDSISQSNQLHTLVWNKMMPEGRSNNVITKEDVLHSFGFDSLEALFPVPARFEEKNDVIERNQTETIVSAILANDLDKQFCLHGGAGFGKSTIARSLIDHMPANSVAVVFDCYGGGTYLDPSDKRHEHEWAILQLANELAVLAGSPLLLMRRESAAVYLRQLKRRLQIAVSIVRKANPDAVVCLIIDAADNSVTAAEQSHAISFVHDLIREPLPDGCKLVLSARTHRLSSLQVSTNCVEISLEPFCREETRKHLATKFSRLEDQQIDEFHTLTKGIPRVQSYALASSEAGIDAVLNPLKPAGKNVENLIEQQIKVASTRVGDPTLVSSVLKYLTTLPRPVPAQYIADLAGTNFNALTDLATDLWHGLMTENNYFSFRDEDYETYLRQTYTVDITDYRCVADLMLGRADSDEYASLHVGNFLALAKRYEQLKVIVLEKKLLNQPTDPIRNREVFVERTRLAMKMALLNGEDKPNYIRLQLVAAEAAKTDKVVKETLFSHAELTTTFGDARTVQQLYFQSEESTWFGPVHLRSAAVYARNGQTHPQAKRHLKSAESWISWWRRLSDEDRQKHGLTYIDLAYGAEAYFWLFGLNEAIDWLKNWNPRYLLCSVIQLLARNVLMHADRAEVIDELKKTQLRTDITIIILAVLNEFGLPNPFNTAEVVSKLTALLDRGFKLDPAFNQSGVSFCEYLSHIAYDKDTVIRLLTQFNPGKPNHVPAFLSGYSFEEDKNRMDLCVRAEALTALLTNLPLTIDQFYPDQVQQALISRDEKQIRSVEYDKKRYDRVFTHIISFYQVRTQVILNKGSYTDFQISYQYAAEKLEQDWELRHYSHDVNELYNYLAVKTLDVILYLTEKADIIQLVKDTFLRQKGNQISLRLAIARKITLEKALHPQVLKLLDEVNDLITDQPLSGSEKLDYYTDCTIIGNHIDHSTGKYYFDKMIAAASDIDVDAYHQIRCIRVLTTTGIIKPNPPLAYEFARFVEFCHERLRGYDHFPWEEVIDTIPQLDCASAYAILCRWDHRGVQTVTKHSLKLLQVSVEQGWIDHTVASALLPLNPYYWEGLVEFIKELIQHYDRARDTGQKSIFMDYLLRDLKMDCPSDRIELMLSQLEQEFVGGRFIEAELGDEFNEHVSFVKNLREPKPERENETLRDVRRDEIYPDDWRQLAAEVNVIDPVDLERAIRQLTGEEPNFFWQERVDLFLEEVSKRCSPEQYVGHLDALTSLEPTLINFRLFKQALETRLAVWNSQPAVKAWKAEVGVRVFKNWFPSFQWHEDHLNASEIHELAALFDVSEENLSSIVAGVIPEFIATLSAPVLYQLVAFTKAGLTAGENEALITWALTRWNQVIKPEFGDGVWAEQLALPNEPDQVTAGFLRYGLGHPDKRVRWRAAHALRRLVHFGNTGVLDQLMLEQNNRICNPFQHASYTYYWLSAKLWLWITIERLALEQPQLITRYKNMLVDELAATTGHALINYFVKNTAIHLRDAEPTLLTFDQLKIIEESLTNQPVLPTKRITQRKKKVTNKKPTELQFDFDHMDTVPFWYKGLGRLYELSSDEVTQMADQVIREHLGFTGDVRKEDHVTSDDTSSKNHYKGTVPTIEDLRTYYEYHALFYVADKLLKTQTLKQGEDHYYDTWEEWLNRWVTVWPNKWLSDLRDPLPYEKPLWLLSDNHSDETWASEVAEHEFDRAIGLTKPTDDGFITVYANLKRSFGKAYEDIYIRSALATAKTAPALLRALQTVNNHHDYNIPMEDGDLEIDRDGFVLKGWLKEASSEVTGVDKDDPLANKLATYYVGAGTEFLDWSKATVSEDFRYTLENDDVIGQFENWTNMAERWRDEETGSEGRRFSINKDTLTSFLSENEYCLIIECQIARRPEERGTDYKYITHTKLYLMHGNGVIESAYSK